MITTLRFTKTYFLLILATAWFQSIGAQQIVTIGSASSTANTSGPTTSTTDGDRNERHTVIYSAAELSAAGLSNGTEIMNIAWEKNRRRVLSRPGSYHTHLVKA